MEIGQREIEEIKATESMEKQQQKDEIRRFLEYMNEQRRLQRISEQEQNEAIARYQQEMDLRDKQRYANSLRRKEQLDKVKI